jgi:ribosomal protein S27E
MTTFFGSSIGRLRWAKSGKAGLRGDLVRLAPTRISTVMLVGKASDWLREERRKTLGDWVSFCLACGFAQRYFDESEHELPAACPQCAGEMRSRCPGCDARFSSVFAVECEACGAELRPPTAYGGPIRKPGR